MANDKPKNQAGRQKLSAVTQAFLTNQDAIKRFVSRFLYRQQDIDDVAQEAFLKAYKAERGRDIEHPKAYLFQIARNVALEGLRKKSSQIADHIVDFDENSITGYEGSVEAHMETQEYLGAFCEAAALLTPKCRRVFLMRKVYGFSYKEITERLGISMSTAEKHMRNGMLQTSAYMREHSDFDEQRDARKAKQTPPKTGEEV
ncbi:RNA polymerase sigma factor [bacterium]|nr:RNA polymerase sigma factor [bacterium]